MHAVGDDGLDTRAEGCDGRGPAAVFMRVHDLADLVAGCKASGTSLTRLSSSGLRLTAFTI